MTIFQLRFVQALAGSLFCACFSSHQAGPPATAPERKPADAWRESFAVDKANLGPTGKNPYFSLMPGTVATFKGEDATLIITVLDQTKVVDRVTTRIIEEREEEHGKPIEISRNFFAIDSKTNDVYYFGEEVDIYKDGKIDHHEGAWLSGVDGAKFGLMMPGTAKVGDRFYQEQAPKVAMDRAEIVAIDATIESPAGKFERCVRIKETSPLEKGSSEKVYAPGVGLVRDDEFTLIKVAEPAPKRP